MVFGGATLYLARFRLRAAEIESRQRLLGLLGHDGRLRSDGVAQIIRYRDIGWSDFWILCFSSREADTDASST